MPERLDSSEAGIAEALATCDGPGKVWIAGLAVERRRRAQSGGRSCHAGDPARGEKASSSPAQLWFSVRKFKPLTRFST